MAFGKVKWFNDSRGFGVIERSGGGMRSSQEAAKEVEEIFVHYSAIESSGGGAQSSGSPRKSLRQGDAVSFDLYASQKGLHARNVKRV
ncbi:MAG: hypothetical protein RJB38_704 [Pseudomonadota bacterium]|jgi:CspA family cold shock protein